MVRQTPILTLAVAGLMVMATSTYAQRGPGGGHGRGPSAEQRSRPGVDLEARIKRLEQENQRLKNALADAQKKARESKDSDRKRPDAARSPQRRGPQRPQMRRPGGDSSGRPQQPFMRGRPGGWQRVPGQSNFDRDAWRKRFEEMRKQMAQRRGDSGRRGWSPRGRSGGPPHMRRGPGSWQGRSGSRSPMRPGPGSWQGRSGFRGQSGLQRGRGGSFNPQEMRKRMEEWRKRMSESRGRGDSARPGSERRGLQRGPGADARPADPRQRLIEQMRKRREAESSGRGYSPRGGGDRPGFGRSDRGPQRGPAFTPRGDMRRGGDSDERSERMEELRERIQERMKEWRERNEERRDRDREEV